MTEEYKDFHLISKLSQEVLLSYMVEKGNKFIRFPHYAAILLKLNHKILTKMTTLQPIRLRDETELLILF